MAEETWRAGTEAMDPPVPAGRTPVNRFDHIRSIIDAVFGPDDDGPVPGVRAMIVPLDEEAVSEQSPMDHALGLGPDASCAVKTPLSP